MTGVSTQPMKMDVMFPVGPTALAVYALLEAGESPKSKPIHLALDWLAKTSLKKTYDIGLRCNAWVSASTDDAALYRKLLDKDAKALLGSTSDGGYGYDIGVMANYPDNSNSQYGLLGVWAAARTGYEVPEEYWTKVRKYWEGCQNGDGGWGYRKADKFGSTGTMTAAGLASLFVCYDNLSLKSFERCDSSGTELQSALRGLKWFNDHFDDMISEKTPFSTPGNAADLYYFLYGVERVALASGYKYFGKSDWYRTGVKRLLETVTSGGAWPHHYSNTDGTPRDDVSTAFALLFLVRGRNAVLFNKLQFPSVGTRKNETNTTDWNCRPRDIAMVTAWLGRTYEMSLNWQIVSLQETPIAEWHDAPVLYIGGSKEPRFLDQDLIKLRKYVLQGGTILSCTECNGAGFRKGIREAYKRMFPEYEMISLPLTHELCTKVSHFDLNGRPRFYAITNGVRLLAIHVDDDLPMAWQQCQIRTKFMGVRRGGQSFHVPHRPRQAPPSRELRLAR